MDNCGVRVFHWLKATPRELRRTPRDAGHHQNCRHVCDAVHRYHYRRNLFEHLQTRATIRTAVIVAASCACSKQGAARAMRSLPTLTVATYSNTCRRRPPSELPSSWPYSAARGLASLPSTIKNRPFSQWGDPGCPPTHGTLGPTCPHLKRHLDRFNRSCRAHGGPRDAKNHSLPPGISGLPI